MSVPGGAYLRSFSAPFAEFSAPFAELGASPSTGLGALSLPKGEAGFDRTRKGPPDGGQRSNPESAQERPAGHLRCGIKMNVPFFCPCFSV